MDARTVLHFSSEQFNCAECIAGKYRKYNLTNLTIGDALVPRYINRHTADDCIVCPAGRILVATLSGYARPDICTICPDGSYLKNNSAHAKYHDKEDDCKACPEGKWG